MTSTPQQLFRALTSRTITKSFGSLLVGGEEHLEQLPSGGVLVVMNHPSWWDPLVGLQLSRLLDGRPHYAAMEAAALERYPIFRRLGFMPVTAGDLMKTRRLLRTASKLMDQDGAVFWLTAQGHFADPRLRPLALHGGAGFLASTMKSGAVLPLAVEYAFGVERQPDIYVRVGEPIPIVSLKACSRAERRETIRAALEATMDTLAAQVVADDQAVFRPLLTGKRGLGGIYDLWLRARAAVSGRSFSAEHRALLTSEKQVSS